MRKITQWSKLISSQLRRSKLPHNPNPSRTINSLTSLQMPSLSLLERGTRLKRSAMKSIYPRKRTRESLLPQLLQKVLSKQTNGLLFTVRQASKLANSSTNRARDSKPKKMLLKENKIRTRKGSSTQKMMDRRRVREVSLCNNRSLSRKRKSLSIILEAPLVATKSSTLSDPPLPLIHTNRLIN